MTKNEEKTTKAAEEVDYTSLAKQCSAEYTLAWKNQKPKKDEWNIRLKLYNNQKRDKDAVGDTTLFTVMQTVIASLYTDRLDVTFEGREDGDEETAENLTQMAEFDYDEMGKAILDYDWIWDTCFFGRGLVAMEEYERDPKNNVFVPMPQVIDPLLFLHDPLATSVNGDRSGKGAMRFGGYEVKMTKQDMLDHPHFFKDKLKFDDISHGGGTESILRDAIESRDYAQGRQPSLKQEESSLGDNTQYDVTIWYTHWKSSEDEKPAKYKVYLINERTEVIGIQKISRKRGKRIVFPIIDRTLYPTAHDWDGTSIPDLVEDKQRARAIAQNLGLKAMKADLYPMYIYDSNRIRNRNDLNFEFNKFVPADIPDGGTVTGAIQPINKASPNLNLIDFIYNSLDTSAQKATATPEIQQGIMSEEKRTLGEVNIIASKVDTRYSLAAKVFGWSEREFWYHWYALYDENFAEDIDEKVLRIVGAFGAKWRPLKRGDIITHLLPDIKIESSAVSRAKELEERKMMIEENSTPALNRGPVDHDVRDQIVVAATEHFRLYGYGKTTVSDLAKSIGFSKAYIYKFFASKQAIGESICANCLDEIQEDVRRAIEQVDQPPEKLRRMFQEIIKASCRLFSADRNLYEIAASAAAERWQATLVYEQNIQTLLQDILQEGRKTGDFERKTPLDEITAAIYLVMRPYLNPLMLQHNFDCIDKAPTQLSNLVLRSLAP